MNHFCTFYVIRTDIWDNFYFDSVFGYSCPPKVMQQHNQTTWRVCGTQQRSQNYISMTGLIYTVFYLNAVRYNMKCNTQLKLCMTTLCLQDSLHSFRHGPDVLVNVLLWYLVPGIMNCGNELWNRWRKVWSGSDKLIKLMPNWLDGIKIRRIWWVGEEGNLIVGEPCLCQFCSMTGCAILLENYSRPLQFHLIIKTFEVSIEDLRNVPLFVHPSSLSPWVFQHNNQPLFPKHDSCPYHGLDIWLFHLQNDTIFIKFLPRTTWDVDLALSTTLDHAFIRRH